MLSRLISTATLGTLLATASPAIADDTSWRLWTAGGGFVAAGTGLALTFTSFRVDHIEGVQTAVGLGLVAGGLVTMALVLGGERRIALVPAVTLPPARYAELPAQSPGLTVAASW